MNVKEMRERLAALYAEGDPLAKKSKDGTLTDAESARLDEILTEVNDLGPQVVEADNRARAAEALSNGHAQYNRPAGASAARQVPRENGNTSGQERPDYRPPVARFIDSDAFRAYQRHPRGKSDALTVGSFHHRQRPTDGFDGDGRVLEFGDDPISPRDLRALIYSGSFSGSFVQPDVFPTIYRGRDTPLMMRDVLVNASTTSDAIVVLQETGFTNAAVEVAEATATTSTGYSDAAKPESALTFAEVIFGVKTIAHWIPITRQALDDTSFLRTYVEARLMVGLQRRENGQILNGLGTGATLRGLYNTSGIQVLNGAYFTANPTENPGTDLEAYERILRAKTLISTVGEAQATFVVLNPTDHEKLQTKADLEARYYGAGPFLAGNVPTLWGLPVVLEAANPVGHALVGDGLMAAVVDRMDAQIFISDSHADFFTHNMLAVLAEERLALPVFRPVAFADVTF